MFVSLASRSWWDEVQDSIYLIREYHLAEQNVCIAGESLLMGWGARQYIFNQRISPGRTKCLYRWRVAPDEMRCKTVYIQSENIAYQNRCLYQKQVTPGETKCKEGRIRSGARWCYKLLALKMKGLEGIKFSSTDFSTCAIAESQKYKRG